MKRTQRTIKREVSYSGVGIHTGKEVSLRFCPAPENSGILFQRIDLPGKPTIPASIEYVQDTSRSTTIGIENVRVHTVEHVLAAIRAFHIDNLIIQVNEAEPPIADGSSSVFVEMINQAGVISQNAEVPIIYLKNPVYWSQGSIHLVAIPANEYRISYTLHYPQNPIIRSQYFSCVITQENFVEDIASCRTFALYEEIAALMERGLIKGGSLENAVVVKDDAIISKEGLRFPDEMVRHKILDIVGDLSLVGYEFMAHVIAVRSGHMSNVAFGKELLKQMTYSDRFSMENSYDCLNK